MTKSEFPEAVTAAGAVRGRREGGLAVFRGIPYARPPVGEARFAASRPADRWDGVREAFAFGPPPPQEPFGPEAAPAGPPPAGDDWLTVNIWTPDADPAARRPVMVWIYGGAYKFGSADDPAYDGSRLARDGDLIVVTLNYRVGIEGFASIEGAPANRALLDQIAALEWVRENITSFGGDPDRVTVFGESAYAGSIAALMAMPRARGLFRRAIAQSVPGTFFSEALAADIAETLAGELGLRPTVADLSGVDPRKLPQAGAALSGRMREYVHRWGPVALTPTPFSPVVDGDVLPTTPWEALAGGAARDVELIAGHNRDEYRLFLMLGGMLGRVDEGLASMALGLFEYGAGRRARLPRRVPGRLGGVPVRTGPVRLAVPHALAALGGGPGGRWRPGAHVRPHLVRSGERRRSRCLPWPGCTADLRCVRRARRHADRTGALARDRGALRPLPLRVDRVRGHGRPGLGGVRQRAAPRPGP